MHRMKPGLGEPRNVISKQKVDKDIKSVNDIYSDCCFYHDSNKRMNSKIEQRL